MLGLELPTECLIAAIMRDDELVVPHGKTTLEVDDRVVFIGSAAKIRQAADMVTESK